MTSTPVREAGPVLTNLAAMQGRSAVNTGAFQKVWSTQMGMSSQSVQAVGNAQDTARTQETNVRRSTPEGNARESSLKPADAGAAESGKVQGNEGQESGKTQESREDAPQNPEEVQDGEKAQEGENAGQAQNPDAVEEGTESAKVPEGVKNPGAGRTEEDVPGPQELAAAMEVLGAAALGMVQEIADAFGIPEEEVLGAMEELGMEPLEVLDGEALSRLVLKLGGAEDSSALITDEALYDNYRLLKGQLGSVLQESAQTLEMTPQEMEGLVEKLSGGEEDLPVEKTILPAQAVEREIPREPERMPEEAESEERPQMAVPAVGEIPGEEQGTQEEQLQGQTRQQSPQSRGAEEQTAGKAEKGQQFHLFGQEFRAGFQPEAVEAPQETFGSTWSGETRQIMNQIMDFMKLSLNADTTNLEMQLHPASLGTVQVQIASKGGMMTAHFITQNEAVKAALESQITQLQDSFEQQGIKVEAIEVTVQTHEFEQNLEQGRERGSQEGAKKNRTRKISLGGEVSGEETEEEDALAAELMAARGGTVDYTV